MTLRSNDPNQFEALAQHALGWAPYLRRLRTWLNERAVDVEVSQVKEKFGGLRVYLHRVDEPNEPDETYERAWSEINAVVDYLEHLSYDLCYLCGAPRTHQGEGQWVRYFCAQHDTRDLYVTLEENNAHYATLMTELRAIDEERYT